jgi:hypothetical protein
MKNNKVSFLSDKWSLNQLIEVQSRRTATENQEHIDRVEALNKRFEAALIRDREVIARADALMQEIQESLNKTQEKKK